MLDDDNMEQEDIYDDNAPEISAPAQPSNKTEENAKEEKQKGTISPDLIRGHINTIILRTLSERDKYGYEIIDEIEKKSHGQYELKQPTLYSALKRLENQGYIKAYWKTDEISAGGRRKYFTLTDSGREITEKNRAEWEYSRTVIDNLISDQEYDFSKPAPKPVDFKILKQSTSRVPTIKLEESGNDDAKEENQTVVAYSYSKVDGEAINLDASQLQFDESHEEQQEEQTEQAVAEATPPKQITPEENLIQEQEARSVNEEIAEQEQYHEPEVQPQAPDLQQQAEQLYASRLHEQTASYFSTESIEQTYGDQYDKYEESAPQNQNTALNQSTEKSDPDNEQYKKQHENYLKLIDETYAGNGQHKTEPVYGENLDTDKLIYINKPGTERDYKNLVNDIYAQTIKPQNAVQEPEPEIYEQAVPTPTAVNEPRKQSNTFYTVQSEESRRAESDGLKIFTSDRQPKPNGKYTRNYNLGEALFKSAAVTFAYMMIIFIVTISCKNVLGVSLVYPFVIFALACCMLAVCAVIALCGFGRNSIKPVSHGYIGACAVLTVIAILIVCVTSILLNIDFGSAADVCIKLVIPCVTLLAVPLYSVMFYVFSK